MRGLLSFFFLISTASSLIGQVQFIRSYGNTGFDYGRDVVESQNRDLFVTGSSGSFKGSNSEAYLMKLNELGVFQWSYNYGGAESEWGEVVVFSKDSNLVVGGYTSSYGAGGFDFYLVKADSSDGTPIWEKTYGGSDWDRCFDLVELADSGFILVGETYSYNGGVRSGYMVRTDKNGDTLWTKLFSGPEEVFLRSVALDLSGDSIVVCGGSANGGLGGIDGYIAKLDTAGNIGWELFNGTAFDDQWNDVYHLDTFYAFGGQKGSAEENNEDQWIMKLNYEDGSEVWQADNTTTSLRQDIVHSVCIRENGPGDFYYAGSTKSFGYSLTDNWEQIYFAKRDPAGGFITLGEYGYEGPDIAHCIKDTYDLGAIVICDTKNYAIGGSNVLIIKVQASWNMPNIDTDLVYQPITTSIESIGKPTFSLYPNPTDGKLSISAELEIDQLSLLSMDGRLLGVFPSGAESIDLSEYESGSYILKFEIDGAAYSRLVIKN